jgi:hypothetical protein
MDIEEMLERYEAGERNFAWSVSCSETGLFMRAVDLSGADLSVNSESSFFLDSN